MPISNPGINNPVSGTETATAGELKTVTFLLPFHSKPNVVITPWGDYCVWLDTVTKTRFKFLNNHNDTVKIDWVADQA